MAKAGFWLRGARGKLAGASMGKGQNGQTIIREIVTPKNPRTEKQLWQRAIMATVMQAYAAGKEIFDHAFQGHAVGAQCQQEFIRQNARRLRSIFANDYQNQVSEDDSVGNATAPGIKTVVPNNYVVSTGSYAQQLFAEAEVKNLNVTTNYTFTLPAVSGNETVAEYAERVGLRAGDIYTFLFIVTDPNDVLFDIYGISAATGLNSVLRGSFGFIRLITKDLSEVDTAASAATFATLFEVETNLESTGIEAVTIGTAVGLQQLLGAAELPDYGYSIGLIRSRFDEDLRSNSQMHIVHNEEFGLGWRDVIPAWKKGTESLGDPSVVLEGSEDEGF